MSIYINQTPFVSDNVFSKAQATLVCVCVRMIIVIMVVFFNRCSDVASRQDGEDECLQERYQQFDQVHEGREQATNNSTTSRPSNAFSIITKQEDQTNQT